jgi:hypothetical protein
MQEQTPVRKRKKKPQAKGVKLAGNNPYQNVPVKTNNLPGFQFPGSVM